MSLISKIGHEYKASLHVFSGYFIASVSTAFISFFSVPLLVRSLDLQEFGRWGLVEPLQSLFSQSMLLGVHYGILKQISLDKRSPSGSYAGLLKASQPVMLSMSLAGGLLLAAFSFTRAESFWFVLLVYTEAALLLGFYAFRGANCVLGYAIASVVKSLLFLCALIANIKLGIPSIRTLPDVLELRFFSTGLGIVSCFLGVYFINPSSFFDSVSPRLKPLDAYKDAISYGFPLLVSGLLAMVIEFADRYILKAYFDYVLLAQYIVYAKIAAFLNPLIISPFGIWWPTERFLRLGDPDGGRAFFRKTSILLLIIFLLAGGGLYSFSPWIIRWFAPGIPVDSAVILVLITSVIFMGMGPMMNVGLLLEGKTHWNILGVFLGALFHVTFCLLLIPFYGILGAALATAFSYLSFTLMLNYLSQRFYPVPFPYNGMVLLMGIFLMETVFINGFFRPDGFLSCVVLSLVFSLIFFLPAWIILRRSFVLTNQ